LDGLVEVFGVQAFIDAPLLRQLEFCRVDVDAVDVRRARLLCGLFDQTELPSIRAANKRRKRGMVSSLDKSYLDKPA
jgi:hypothetical protein